GKEFPGNALPSAGERAGQLRITTAATVGHGSYERLAGERMKTLGDVFDDQCRRTPDVPAIVSRTTRLTFADLHRWTAQLSLTMAPHVGPGQRVALLLPDAAAFAAALLAATRVGGVVAPLDAARPALELTGRLAELDPAALVTDGTGMASAIAATSDLREPPALVLLHDGGADVIQRRATRARAGEARLPAAPSARRACLGPSRPRRPLARAGRRRAQGPAGGPGRRDGRFASSAAADSSLRCSRRFARARRSTRERPCRRARSSGCSRASTSRFSKACLPCSRCSPTCRAPRRSISRRSRSSSRPAHVWRPPRRPLFSDALDTAFIRSTAHR